MTRYLSQTLFEHKINMVPISDHFKLKFRWIVTYNWCTESLGDPANFYITSHQQHVKFENVWSCARVCVFLIETVC